MTGSPRLLIVSPVRNEAGHIESVVAAMAAQTRPPDLWLVADDSSEDGTAEILIRLEPTVPFMRVVEIPSTADAGTDRLALALEAKAFNRALGEIDWGRYTHLGKVDGDIALPEDYFERLLRAFEIEPRLGITGGSIVEPGRAGRWTQIGAPEYHVHGALKLYSLDCFRAVGGVQERLGWDTIDETYARMRGYATRRQTDLVARHHRPGASGGGRLRGRARHGRCAYIARYGFLWTFLRSFKVGVTCRPRGLSGLAFLCGYVGAALGRAQMVQDGEFKAFVRRELRGRLRSAVHLARATRPDRRDQDPAPHPGGPQVRNG
jgi:glycosyltransferase involved in cell wall biosynthesis